MPYNLAVFLFQMLAGTSPPPPAPPPAPSAAPEEEEVEVEEGVEGGETNNTNSAAAAQAPLPETQSDPSIGALLDNAAVSESTMAFSAPLPPGGVPALPLAVRIQRCGGGEEVGMR